jgi:tetratricopeptide (TPR) repeat protein
MRVVTDYASLGREIAETFRNRRDDGKPGHVLIGAGCSKSAGIPLARELVDEILKRHATMCERRFCGVRPSYGAAMSALSPNERRDLITPYIDHASINWGHIALAAMLKGGEIDTVLTVNFDNLLARACGLLGIYPATYDFGAAPFERLAGIASPAIIHLHGQGHGMVLMNTEEETRAHAQKVAPVLRRSLESRPMLVVGYSGDADDLFAALRAGYSGGERLYWLTYDDAPPAALRDFMKDHPHIHHFGGCDADRVLIEIARGCQCWPPKLFENPYEHLLEELGPVLDLPLEERTSGDILGRTRAALATASDTHKRTSDSDAAVPALKGDFKAAERAAEEAGDTRLRASLLTAQGHEIVARYQRASSTEEKENLAQEAIAAYAAAIDLDPQQHEALNNWGYLLWDRGKRCGDLQKAARLFDEAAAKYAEALRIKPDDHDVLFNWGNLLFERGKRCPDPQEAARLFDEAAAKYAEAVRIKPNTHEALSNWGLLLMERGQRSDDPQKATRLFDEASAKLLQSEKLRPGVAAYNLACLAVLRGQKGEAQAWLEASRKAGRLPSKAHILADADFASVRDEDWFRAFVASLPD